MPEKCWPLPWQAPGGVNRQLEPQQHAPIHSAPGVHTGTTVPPIAWQSALETITHGPLGRQHATTCTHWFGEHVLPGAGVEPVGHDPATVKHEPSLRQHALRQGLGTHVGPALVVPGGHGPTHTKHAVRSQHACFCGHGLGTHGVPPR
jgi:hypothetical protein